MDEVFQCERPAEDCRRYPRREARGKSEKKKVLLKLLMGSGDQEN
jgi:hypothetical protein